MAILMACTAMVSCKPKALPEPKPMGYFRIDLPEHKYKSLDAAQTSPCKQAEMVVTPPFTCEQSVHAKTTM